MLALCCLSETGSAGTTRSADHTRRKIAISPRQSWQAWGMNTLEIIDEVIFKHAPCSGNAPSPETSAAAFRYRLTLFRDQCFVDQSALVFAKHCSQLHSIVDQSRIPECTSALVSYTSRTATSASAVIWLLSGKVCNQPIHQPAVAESH